ncbi:MAG: toxin [Bacteroidota bacterium]
MGQIDLLEIEVFLNQLKAKIPIYGIVFENREKNTQALLQLGITPIQRKEHIKQLSPKNYISGPLKDQFGGKPLWVFGKIITGQEVYIKVQINQRNKPVICISFHLAEYPLNFHFK